MYISRIINPFPLELSGRSEYRSWPKKTKKEKEKGKTVMKMLSIHDHESRLATRKKEKENKKWIFELRARYPLSEEFLAQCFSFFFFFFF